MNVSRRTRLVIGGVHLILKWQSPAMRVRTVGVGTPVVLVHGLAGSSRWWRDVTPALALEHAVHLVDLPRWQAYDPDELVDRIARRFADLSPATYIGHSLGGLLSVRLAARHPETVDRLVLVSPAGIARPLGGRLGRAARVGVASRRAVLPPRAWRSTRFAPDR